MSSSFFSKWWIYQRERFPVLAHGLLIASFSFSAVSFSSLLRGCHQLPDGKILLVAFVNSFISFLQLRIADEFKDFDEDSRYRPYRPVPRGLVTLRELGWLWGGSAAVQVALALWLNAHLLWLLAINWIYLTLMSREFFAREWLKQRPITYLWSHMLIMPLIDFYATACDWLPATGKAPAGLFWFVVVSFFNGIVIEIGRKVRSPEKEEDGVQTYSALWGGARASCIWISVMTVTALSAILAAGLIQFRIPVAVCLLGLVACGLVLVACFARSGLDRYAKWFEKLSGVWTILLYLILGAIPLCLQILRAAKL